MSTPKANTGATKTEKQHSSTATTAVSPSLTPTPSPALDDPAWLCDQGEYYEFIRDSSGSNPGLRSPDPNNGAAHLKKGNARVVLLQASNQGAPEFASKDFRSITDLRRHFADSIDQDHDSKRIYIMEGLAPDFIAAVGGHFFMDPSFFLRQERTCVWSNDFTPTSDALPQISLLDPEKMFHLQYCELRQFNKAIENRYHFCQRTRRHVGMTPPRHKDDSTTGILRRKTTWWCRTTAKGGWDVVILCDPQLCSLSPTPKEVCSHGFKDIKNPDELLNEPFNAGYLDFLPPASRHRAATKPQHQHKSMLEDLMHYLKNHADLFPAEAWHTPNPSALFLQKIVAAHYLQLVDYIKAMLPSLELKLTTAWIDEQDQWRSLQTISRRCGNYRDDVEDTLLSLDAPLRQPAPRAHAPWSDTARDFQYIYHRLAILKERADTLMQSMTGLASIAGNRQNLDEAKRVKRLNLLALLFIPLAYTSSLFSMQDAFAPGNGQFWVYWVSAIVVVVLTLGVTWVLDSALDDAAQWQLGPLMWLKFWDAEQRPRALKRKGTLYDKL